MVPFPFTSLKDTIETLYGIPSEIQHLYYNDVELKDEQTLHQISINNDQASIVVSVDVHWNELVCYCLQGNNTSLQQISIQHDDVVLISLLISATRSF